MTLNILLVTQYRWDSRTRKNNALKNLLMLCPDFTDVQITMEYRNLGKPDMYTNSRGSQSIKESWFEKHISSQAKADGYTHAGFIFSVEDGNRWGISHGHRGSNFVDKDFFGEFWVKVNEGSTRSYHDGRRNTYETTVPHEIGHEIKRQKLTEMKIHDYDYQSTINNIERFFSELRITKQSQIDVLFGRTVDLMGITITKLRAILKDITH